MFLLLFVFTTQSIVVQDRERKIDGQIDERVSPYHSVDTLFPPLENSTQKVICHELGMRHSIKNFAPEEDTETFTKVTSIWGCTDDN